MKIESASQTAMRLAGESRTGRLLTMPPHLVVRPSGVWNSRYPLRFFLAQHARCNRLCHGLVVAIDYVIRNSRVDDEGLVPQSLKQFIQHRKLGMVPGKAFKSYWKAFEASKPKLEDFVGDLKSGIGFIRAAILIQYSGSFETYVQCWALNLLLAKLETGVAWTESELAIAQQLSPVHDMRRLGRRSTTTAPLRSHSLPYAPTILKSFPNFFAVIKNLKSAVTGSSKAEGQSSSPESGPSALEMVLFWRDYRNLCVHRAGLVSRSFFDRHCHLWEYLRHSRNQAIPPMTIGKRLYPHDDTLRSAFLDHLHLAKDMNAHLIVTSQSARGKPPNSSNGDSIDPMTFLLRPGDHALSFEWDQLGRGVNGNLGASSNLDSMEAEEDEAS